MGSRFSQASSNRRARASVSIAVPADPSDMSSSCLLVLQVCDQHAATRTVQLDRARRSLLGCGGCTQEDHLPCLEAPDGLREPDQPLSYVAYVPYRPFGQQLSAVVQTQVALQGFAQQPLSQQESPAGDIVRHYIGDDRCAAFPHVAQKIYSQVDPTYGRMGGSR